MRKIASFTVDHDRLVPGMYVSRIDGDAVTYDVRMKRPNAGDYLSTGAAHTLEHLLATFIRNSEYSDATIYVGPMGCRTGFYIIFRDSVPRGQALDIVREAFLFAAGFDGEIPGNTSRECGNYRDHDLAGARREAEAMARVLAVWTPEKMGY